VLPLTLLSNGNLGVVVMNVITGYVSMAAVNKGSKSGSTGGSSSAWCVYKKLCRLLPKFWLLVLFTVLHKHARGDYRLAGDAANVRGGGAAAAGAAAGEAAGEAAKTTAMSCHCYRRVFGPLVIDGEDGLLCALQDIVLMCSLAFQFSPRHFFPEWEIHGERLQQTHLFAHLFIHLFICPFQNGSSLAGPLALSVASYASFRFCGGCCSRLITR
jgi:hypothetical protein